MTSSSPIDKSPRLSTKSPIVLKEKPIKAPNNLGLVRRNSLERRETPNRSKLLLASKSKSTLSSSGAKPSVSSKTKDPVLSKAAVSQNDNVSQQQAKWDNERSKLKTIILDNSMKFDVIATCLKVVTEENVRLKAINESKSSLVKDLLDQNKNLKV